MALAPREAAKQVHSGRIHQRVSRESGRLALRLSLASRAQCEARYQQTHSRHYGLIAQSPRRAAGFSVTRGPARERAKKNRAFFSREGKSCIFACSSSLIYYFRWHGGGSWEGTRPVNIQSQGFIFKGSQRCGEKCGEPLSKYTGTEASYKQPLLAPS